MKLGLLVQHSFFPETRLLPNPDLSLVHRLPGRNDLEVDILDVTSIVRALGLKQFCYDRVLDFFHETGLHLDKLSRIWTKTVLKIFSDILRTNGRLLIVGDGIKIPKEGRKMPILSPVVLSLFSCILDGAVFYMTSCFPRPVVSPRYCQFAAL